MPSRQLNPSTRVATWALPWLWVLSCFFLSSVDQAVALGFTPPKAPPAKYRVAVNATLWSAEGRRGIDLRIGTAPTKCVDHTETTELCEWRLFDQNAGWDALAKAIDTPDRIVLLCEIPKDGSRRAPDACSAHPQRSNRRLFLLTDRLTKGGKPVSRKQLRVLYQKLADGWIKDATTMSALSRLMGFLPNNCFDLSSEMRSCSWSTNNRTYGHGTLSEWIGASRRKRVRLTCILPRAGGPRAPDSCKAEKGT